MDAASTTIQVVATQDRTSSEANAAVAVLRTWRPTRPRILSLLLNAVITAGVVYVVLLISPGITSTNDLSVALTVVVLAAVSHAASPTARGDRGPRAPGGRSGSSACSHRPG